MQAAAKSQALVLPADAEPSPNVYDYAGIFKSLRPNVTEIDSMRQLTKLASSVQEAATVTKPPLVLLHGIFGGKQNWRVVADHLTRMTPRRVYAADLPNHGESAPRTDHMDIFSMSRDVIGFLNEVAENEKSRLRASGLPVNQRVPIDLLGHSLGGTVSMITALKTAEAVRTGEVNIAGMKMKLHFDLSSLIVVDMSPHRYRREYGALQRTRNGQSSRSVSLENVVRLLNSVELQKYADMPIGQVRRDVDRKLEPLISYRGLRAFLRTSLRETRRDGRRAIEWHFNLEAISRSAGALLNWPQEVAFERLVASNIAFDKPVLFLGGSFSDFVHTSDLPELRKVFPRCSIEHIEGAGHWVQADKPLAFVDTVVKFIDTAL